MMFQQCFDFKDDLNLDIFYKILNAVSQAVLITDPTGKVIFYNDSHARMDGLDREEVLGRNVTDIYEMDDNSSLVMQSIRSGEAITDQLSVFKVRNGKVVNTVVNVQPLSKQGEHIGFVSCVTDWQYLKGLQRPTDALRGNKGATLDQGYCFKDIIGSNGQLLQVLNRARQAADSPSSVLIYGQTGTGKELVAQSIHNHSSRRDKPYMAVNCAAIPDTLLETMLFGSTRGAFTGAIDKKGLLEPANGGTLLLDEINSMPVTLQAKILRVLQDKKVCRIGGMTETALDIKIIASLNIRPDKAVEKKELREDLLYRLGVVYLELPSLVDRMDDLPALVEHFIAKFNARMQKNVSHTDQQVLQDFAQYHWPGNIRELENHIESAMNMIGNETTIQPWHLTAYSGWQKAAEAPGIPQVDTAARQAHEKEQLIHMIQCHSGNLTRVAQELNISRNTLYRRLKQYQVDPKQVGNQAVRKQIESALHHHGGNISRSARALDMSRQALAYQIKKLNLDPKVFKFVPPLQESVSQSPAA